MPDALVLREVRRVFRARRRWFRPRKEEVVAVDGVSLAFPKGTITALLGPSGAGKTTLLRMAGLLDRPSSGDVMIDGSPVTWAEGEVRALRRRVGILLQNPAMFRRSVRANVAFGLEMQGVPEKAVEAKVGAALKRVGLGALADRDARRLSGGEAQRLAFARATVLRPEILLLDEFTVHLDYQNVATLERLVRDFQKVSGGTVVLVTHSQRQALRLADRAALVVDGRLIAAGGVHEVLEEPADPRAREFVLGDFSL